MPIDKLTYSLVSSSVHNIIKQYTKLTKAQYFANVYTTFQVKQKDIKMAEKLSPDDNRTASILYEEHKRATGEHDEWRETVQNEAKTAEATRMNLNRLYMQKDIGDEAVRAALREASIREYDKVQELSRSYDEHDARYGDRVKANLWDAQEHKNEHLGEYIETARQEAGAQGVPINLEPPKEQ
jgi:hypothetical protein